MKKILAIMVVGALFAGCTQTGTSSSYSSASPTAQASSSPSDYVPTTSSPSPSATPSTMMPKTISLTAQNGSGENGTATLTPNTDGTTTVMISLTGGKWTTPQPAHIHIGSCPNPGQVVYPLNDVVKGQSTTTVKASLDQIMASSPNLAINVHKSAAQIKSYTACGNLK